MEKYHTSTLFWRFITFTKTNKCKENAEKIKLSLTNSRIENITRYEKIKGCYETTLYQEINSNSKKNLLFDILKIIYSYSSEWTISLHKSCPKSYSSVSGISQRGFHKFDLAWLHFDSVKIFENCDD